MIQFMRQIVNERHDDDPIIVIDAIWLLNLGKTRREKDKDVPERCELVAMTTMTLTSIIILIMLLGTIEILMIARNFVGNAEMSTQCRMGVEEQKAYCGVMQMRLRMEPSNVTIFMKKALKLVSVENMRNQAIQDQI